VNPAIGATRVNFDKEVWPILKENCIKCHQAPKMVDGKLKKPKAGLRLDAPSHIINGSEEGPVIEPGYPEKSVFYTLTILDDGDDDIMPPKGDPLTGKQTDVIKQWIKEGADFGDWHGTDPPPVKLTAAQQKLVKELDKQLGAIVIPAAKGSGELRVNLKGMREKADDAFVARLAPVAEYVVSLDLSGTPVTDAALTTVGKMQRLEDLRLASTKVTDAGVAQLKGLEKLHLVGLYGTGVTPASLQTLGGLPALDALYISETKIPRAACEAFAKQHPKVMVNLGWDITAVDTITTAAFSNSAAFLKPGGGAPPAKGKKRARPKASASISASPLKVPKGWFAFDFESGDLQGWKTLEGGFLKFLTDRSDFHHNQGPYNKQGKYFISTLEQPSGSPNDKPMGVAESPVFTLKGAEMSFLVGGGNHGNTYVALCTTDGKEHLRASGSNAQKMNAMTWTAPKALIGKKVFVRLVDGNPGGWGHVTFDAFKAQGEIDAAATEAYRKTRKRMLTSIPAPPKAGKRTKPAAPPAVAQQISKTGIKHSILVTGPKTAIIGEDNSIEWEAPGGSRDGYLLDSGNILITFSREVKEFKRDGSVVFHYKLAAPNKEISTSQRLPNGNTMIVEMGARPRLREVAPDGKIAVEFALQPETGNTHMQTRMARKLANGNYLCPHLLAFAIKEYKPDGTVVRTIKTDLPELGGREKRNWPFTAILLNNGNIMANLTNGNKTVEFTPDGKVAWVATNENVAGRFADPCGGQVLPNGNVVITSYGQRDPTKTKIFELNKNKEVVWEYIDPRYRSAHGIHVLTTNGEPVKPAMK
jgi:hypothetical protein